MITISALNDLQRVRHGFFTREGGVSEGPYASLNVGFASGDAPERVATNRSRAMAMLDLPAEALVTLRQEHTATVVEVTRPWRLEEAPVGDAMVTRLRGVALGILTADCAPILIAAPDAGVIAAVHAGWKGALGGVIANTIAAMADLGARPKGMVAAVGPCIAHRSYEVGPEFPAPFLAADAFNRDFFSPAPRPGHFLFDLAAFAARQLALAGIGEVLRTPCDTYREESRFFSYRRASQRGEGGYGRQLSAIVLET